jgi:hypothetical protein
MKKLFILTFIFLSTASLAEKTQEEKENELVDFNSIKKVLKSDMLGTEIEKKQIRIDKFKKKKEKRAIRQYEIPAGDEFWGFFSEYWLVKNAAIVKWDFQKPDYGLRQAFQFFLEKMGVFEKKFKILLVNTPVIAHMALPSNDGEIIFLLSVPFIRTLDLSKLEISIILFEDYLRAKNKYFENYATVPKLNSFLGQNFYKKPFDVNVLKDISKKYDEMIYEKGFTFQQQFAVTKTMATYFKSELKLWNSYYRLLKKIDGLVKTNILYSKYIKIFPSPELQMSWLKPKAKKVF